MKTPLLSFWKAGDRSRRRITWGLITFLSLILLSFLWHRSTLHREAVVNISYDASRELFRDLNIAYSKDNELGESDLRVVHGGSISQAMGVLSGLRGDVVTLASAAEIDYIAEKTNLIKSDWGSRFPYNSSPYTSTIVFLVRKNNPHQILDWADLTRDELDVRIPHPDTSGAGRWVYLAAWGAAYLKTDKNRSATDQYVNKLCFLATLETNGARTSLLRFLNSDSDVLVTWENEAHYAASHLAKDKVEVVTPGISIIAEPAVAVVDSYVAARGTHQEAHHYVSYLFTHKGQMTIARNYLRPRDSSIPIQLPILEQFKVSDLFGSLDSAIQNHFDAGGAFSKTKELRALNQQN